MFAMCSRARVVQETDSSEATDWLSTPYGSLWLVLHGVGVFFLVLIMELVTGWGFFKVASMVQGLRRRVRNNVASTDRTWGTGGRYQAVRGVCVCAAAAVPNTACHRWCSDTQLENNPRNGSSLFGIVISNCYKVLQHPAVTAVSHPDP